MPIKKKIFQPHFTITPTMARNLMRIEAIKEEAVHLPLTPRVLASLRESAAISTMHYSTKIEGNRLTLQQVKEVIKQSKHFSGRERDEREIRGYQAALNQLERWVAQKKTVTERMIKLFHALVMGGGSSTVQPTPYRDGQNVIRDGATGAIVYLPPEAHDVPQLVMQLVDWVNNSTAVPSAIVAGIAHYEYATIHPYYDGNGRTARLLTTFVLHSSGYDLKGIYSLEEYYAKDLATYYQSLALGPSHNYYEGRAQADITPWLEYFLEGMVYACQKVADHLRAASHRSEPDLSSIMRQLDVRQRRIVELFYENRVITAAQVAVLLGVKQRTASHWCKEWVDSGFLQIVDPSKKSRTYSLSKQYARLIKSI